MYYETIRNYYEQLVFDHIHAIMPNETNTGYLADIACVALNHLPPRYFRHEVDMSYFLSPIERKEIQEKVANAVQISLSIVSKSEQG